MLFVVPQSSVLGPLLFYVCICDLLFEVKDLMIRNLEKLEKVIQSMSDWFTENILKSNADKCHLIVSFKVPVAIRISDVKVTSESSVKFLGIHIDHRLNFDYVSQLCKKASKKLHALGIVLKYVGTSKRRVFVNSFITLQFSYCSLIWMFPNGRMQHRISKIEMAFHLIYPSSSKVKFKELLDKIKKL